MNCGHNDKGKKHNTKRMNCDKEHTNESNVVFVEYTGGNQKK